MTKAHGHDRTDRDGYPLLTFIFGRKTVPDTVTVSLHRFPLFGRKTVPDTVSPKSPHRGKRSPSRQGSALNPT